MALPSSSGWNAISELPMDRKDGRRMLLWVDMHRVLSCRANHRCLCSLTTAGPIGWRHDLAKFCQTAYICSHEHDEHFIA